MTRPNRITPPDLTEAEALRLVEELDLKCPQCGYALRGLGKLDCPECGLSIPPYQVGAMREETVRRRRGESSGAMFVTASIGLVAGLAFIAISRSWNHGPPLILISATWFFMGWRYRVWERRYSDDFDSLAMLKKRLRWRVCLGLMLTGVAGLVLFYLNRP